MIKLFRKIRQNLLSEGKTGKYLKYAIGEIVLVVIGILIALQINTWNEGEKLKSKEIEILKTMSDLLDQDQNSLELAIPFNQRIRNSIDLILTRFKDDLPYQDSLKYHFGNTITIWTSEVKISAFENLKSEGINLISNKTLRDEIIDYYDSGDYTDKLQAESYRSIIENAAENLLNTRFYSFWESNYEDWMTHNEKAKEAGIMNIQVEMVPNDFETLKKDEKYIYFLRSLKNINSWYMDRMFRLNIIRVKKLKTSIETELKFLQ